MHPDSGMLQWGQLDKHDLEAERDAEAQREDFERRLPQVQKNRSTVSSETYGRDDKETLTP